MRTKIRADGSRNSGRGTGALCRLFHQPDPVGLFAEMVFYEELFTTAIIAHEVSHMALWWFDHNEWDPRSEEHNEEFALLTENAVRLAVEFKEVAVDAPGAPKRAHYWREKIQDDEYDWSN